MTTPDAVPFVCPKCDHRWFGHRNPDIPYQIDGGRCPACKAAGEPVAAAALRERLASNPQRIVVRDFDPGEDFQPVDPETRDRQVEQLLQEFRDARDQYLASVGNVTFMCGTCGRQFRFADPIMQGGGFPQYCPICGVGGDWDHILVSDNCREADDGEDDGHRCDEVRNGARCILPFGHDDNPTATAPKEHRYRCAGGSCPGLAWPASEMPHPASCSKPPEDPDDFADWLDRSNPVIGLTDKGWIEWARNLGVELHTPDEELTDEQQRLLRDLVQDLEPGRYDIGFRKTDDGAAETITWRRLDNPRPRGSS